MHTVATVPALSSHFSLEICKGDCQALRARSKIGGKLQIGARAWFASMVFVLTNETCQNEVERK